MGMVLGLVATIFGPPVLGLAVAWILLGIHLAAVALGKQQRERIPPFLILWLRGMVIVVAIAAALGIWYQFAQVPTRG